MDEVLVRGAVGVAADELRRGPGPGVPHREFAPGGARVRPGYQGDRPTNVGDDPKSVDVRACSSPGDSPSTKLENTDD